MYVQFLRFVMKEAKNCTYETRSAIFAPWRPVRLLKKYEFNAIQHIKEIRLYLTRR